MSATEASEAMTETREALWQALLLFKLFALMAGAVR